MAIDLTVGLWLTPVAETGSSESTINFIERNTASELKTLVTHQYLLNQTPVVSWSPCNTMSREWTSLLIYIASTLPLLEAGCNGSSPDETK